MKHLEVVAAIIQYNNKILCMQRNIGKYEYTSLKYEFPGGKIEANETKEHALKRELMEEMEMDIKIESQFLTVNHAYPDFEITMYSFLCSVDKQEFKLKEHKSFKWLSVDKLSTLDWAEADKPIVEKLMEK